MHVSGSWALLSCRHGRVRWLLVTTSSSAWSTTPRDLKGKWDPPCNLHSDQLLILCGRCVPWMLSVYMLGCQNAPYYTEHGKQCGRYSISSWQGSGRPAALIPSYHMTAVRPVGSLFEVTERHALVAKTRPPCCAATLVSSITLTLVSRSVGAGVPSPPGVLQLQPVISASWIIGEEAMSMSVG